jgi:hypothetical protein
LVELHVQIPDRAERATEPFQLGLQVFGVLQVTRLERRAQPPDGDSHLMHTFWINAGARDLLVLGERADLLVDLGADQIVRPDLG